MGLHLHDIGTLSIPNAQQNSSAFSVPSVMGEIATGGLDVYTPATLPETCVLQAAPSANPQAADWKTVQWQPGSDATLAAARCVSVPFAAGMRSLRIQAGVAVAAQRDFYIVVQIASDDGQ